ncbi:hypothetical protein N7517_008624 [Penicillium concentricum]|uniref:Alcohol dehydrogenase-like N-terminal domain-containing protein n=1 Tax=Penicillium concentricum TaxID=293559 RepID=A0A9W9V1V1_9EURO|nr:uncharacterized protein N7517_008624 [Penicillium concentricum]KAJ5365738.1 hypothetical protein N7517_008624 [Penicillium concentricum]
MPHKAIWVNSDATQEVKSIPGDYKPPKGDLLLKTICVAVNPGDFKHPETFGAVNTVEGFDAVGEVIGIGPETEGFKIGEKVLTFARGIGPAEWGASQEFFLALAATCWNFDESKLSEDQAATIPLALFTAWADIVLDYKDENIVERIKEAIPGSKKLQHGFNCVGASVELLEDVIDQGGSIILSLPPTAQCPGHHVEMAIAGTVHNLETFRVPEFKFHRGVEPRDSHGAEVLRSIMHWTLKEIGVRYQLPRVRTLGGRGMYDAFEAFALMRENRISGEKVVWRMSETPGLL